MRSSIIGVLALASTTGLAFADNQKPTVPANVDATAISDTAVRVTWSASYDNDGVDGYNIYRNGRYYATVHDTTSYIDERVTPGSVNEYAVVAFDDARNYTVLSEGDAVDAVDGGSGRTGAAPFPSPATNDRPNWPSGLSASAQGSDRVALSWNAVSGAAGYNVYRDGSYRATVRDTSWTDAGLEAGREYRYAIVTFSSDPRYKRKFSLASAAVSARTGGASSAPVETPVAAPAAAAPSNDGGGGSGVPAGYRLVFSDEFNGGGVDSSKWNTRHLWGPNLTINNEQQYYVDKLLNPDFGVQPFQFDGNNLSIVADRTPGSLKSSANHKSYTSGVLTTYGKFKMRYGYVEMRAKLPKGHGLWPAFWLLHHEQFGNQSEIDIMEFLGRDPNRVYQVYHSRSGSSPTMEVSGPDYTSGFHTYGVKWTPGEVVYYVDGKETNRYSGGGVSNEDMYIILNLALGGSWAGWVNDSTPFPARYTIDYVRAYQR